MVRSSDSDKVTVVGCGVTLYEALTAYETLKNEGINIRVVDIFTLKPIDTEALLACVAATGNKIITVEDHYQEGQCLLEPTEGGCGHFVKVCASLQ